MSMKTYLLLCFLACSAAADQPNSADVSLANGIVTGFQIPVGGRNVWQFLGIPFAEPPVGELRFQRPLPLSRVWQEPLVANKAPNGCLPVSEMAIWPADQKPTYDEDCLYLDVWTPTLDVNAKKAVLVWIHGGGFSMGEGLPLYDGKGLASIGDVVVVTIQYRLGFLGFARFDENLVPGNNGLFDQQMALRWVHENIGKFGGDPDSVAIIGESAGSASVSYHILNAESSKYFKRGIMQSGAANSIWSENPNTGAMERANREISLKYFKCDQVNTNELLTCLRGISGTAIMEAMKNYTLTHMSGPYNTPTIDGHFVSKSVKQLLANSEIQPKDVIIGMNEDEGSLFANFMTFQYAADKNITNITTDHLTEEFSNFAVDVLLTYYPSFPYKPSDVTKKILRLKARSHVDSNRGDLNALKVSELLGQYLIDCSVNSFADAIRSIHDNVYVYRMTHKPTKPLFPGMTADWSKCTHGDDIPYVFAYPITHEIYKDHMTDDEIHLSYRMIKDFAHFAKTGKPLDPNWRPFTLKNKEYYKYDIRSSLETGGISRDACVFWNHVIPMVNSVSCKKEPEKCVVSSVDPVQDDTPSQRPSDEL